MADNPDDPSSPGYDILFALADANTSFVFTLGGSLWGFFVRRALPVMRQSFGYGGDSFGVSHSLGDTSSSITFSIADDDDIS